jgi:hypothetical protein
MRLFALDLENEGSKPHLVLDWMKLPYTRIFSLDEIKKEKNSVVFAMPKQFENENVGVWNSYDRAVEMLSPNFDKVILFNDDDTEESALFALQKQKKQGYVDNNVWVLGYEMDTDEKGRPLEHDFYFNYVVCIAAHHQIFSHTPTVVNLLRDRYRDKYYTNLNRFPKAHRIYHMIQILKNNFHQFGYNSFLYNKMDDDTIYNYLNDIPGLKSNVTTDDIELLRRHLPMETGADGDIQIKWSDELSFPYSLFPQIISINFEHILNSYTRIVNETSFMWQDKTMITEKITGAFTGMQPFLLSGQPHILWYLRQKGFETFPELFDESYDTEKDDLKRLLHINDEIRKLCLHDKKTIHDIYYQLYDKLEHNFHQFKHFIQDQFNIIQRIIDE